MTNMDLTPDALKAIKNLCQRYGVRELSIFGSALREDFSATSDIDLLVEFEPEAQVGFVTLSKMQRELSRILHRPVDLIPKKGLKPKIREAVISSAKVLYAP
jgi:predicted nucleotidyltransferase